MTFRPWEPRPTRDAFGRPMAVPVSEKELKARGIKITYSRPHRPPVQPPRHRPTPPEELNLPPMSDEADHPTDTPPQDA